MVDENVELQDQETVLGKRNELSEDEDEGEEEKPPMKVMKVEVVTNVVVDDPVVISAFEELLGEHKVSQFSFWDMIQPKISEDPRCIAIPSKKQQKQLFEEYAKNSAKRKLERVNTARTLFDKHLAVAKEEGILKFSDFIAKFEGSAAFEILPKDEQRKLFDKEFGQIQKMKQLDARENMKLFEQMLRECKSIRSDSRWSRVKDRLRDDYRYDLLDYKTRGDVFYEYTDKLYREEEYLRHNQKLHEKKRHHREHLATRKNFEEQEAESQLMCLFSEFITKPCSWNDAVTRISDKSRFRTKYINSRRKEELFEKHLKTLEKDRAGTFYQLLVDTVPSIPLGAIFETTQSRLQNDPRYSSLQNDEQRKEVFKQYQDKLLEEAENGFKKLLKNMMTEITLSKCGKQFESALTIIKRDPRWKALDLRSDRRDALLEEYKSTS